MSLVNKMLRDLDARRVGDGERAALPPAVTPLAARLDSARTPSWVWLAAVFLVATLAASAWYASRTGSADTIPPAAPMAVVTAPATALPVQVVAPMATAPVQPETTTIAPAPPPGDAAVPALRMADQLSTTPAHPPAARTPEYKPLAAPPPAPVVATRQAAPAPVESRIDKQQRIPSASERAEGEYHRGVLAMRQGDVDGATGAYRAALEILPEHAAARQALAALLIDAKRFEAAEEVLRKGIELPSTRLAATLAWARLKVERNDAPAALEMLQRNAASGERSAEYQGFAGALLNRSGRAAEAVEHYRAATRLAPNEGRWWAGLGIALDAAGKAAEAQEAYHRARSLPGLPADLAQHIEQRLR